MNPPRPVLPPHAPGLRVGLYGGSFNPAHAAHRAVSLLALKRLGLDVIWWLVTPGNPLKSTAGLAPLASRMAGARALARHPRLIVTDVEARLGTRFTADTLAALKARAPGVRFVWLMGADNLAQFHRWRHADAIMASMPVAVVDRRGQTFRAAASRTAQRYAHARLDETDGPLLAYASPPAWTFVHGLKSALSSSAIRAGQA